MSNDLTVGSSSTDLGDGSATDRDRISRLEDRLAVLSSAAEAREKEIATEIAAYQTAYAERVGYLEAHVAALREAASLRERDIEAHNAAHAEQSQELQKQITSYQDAYRTRVGELEAQVAELVAAAERRQQELQARQQSDYQILMTHQNLLAEFKDLEPDFIALYDRCKSFTMTSVERLYSLYKIIEYIVGTGIAGDFAECGVWRGGSCMLIALGLLRGGETGRGIYMFDTFEGHPRPNPDCDVDLWGNRAIDEWHRQEQSGTVGNWGAASLAEVQSNLLSTGYPADRLHFVKGMVEETVTLNPPEALALLRLDTDWYESTKSALFHLYPRLAAGGVLIIDDYGHYHGQRKAVDEYFAQIGEKPLLHRIDYSCRVMVKSTRQF